MAWTEKLASGRYRGDGITGTTYEQIALKWSSRSPEEIAVNIFRDSEFLADWHERVSAPIAGRVMGHRIVPDESIKQGKFVSAWLDSRPTALEAPHGND